ncbi:hypothetical protein [Peptoclostridium acidaminophilum]|uniref:hypothetical protein n=1 Tax=Peptoclostridium acidaminophilum TaxID=1731 RepID=UPI00046D0BD6|nr:hypothetical protein [Peptoclostridium acidaminophilum]
MSKKSIKKVILLVASLLMMLSAPFMLLRCLDIINFASADYKYAGLGCFWAAMTYAFSMVTAIAGLVFAKQSYRHHWCRVLAYMQLAAGIILVFPLNVYAIPTLSPLFVLTILYLFGTGWHDKHSCD